jgi:hypothetical protein
MWQSVGSACCTLLTDFGDRMLCRLLSVIRPEAIFPSERFSERTSSRYVAVGWFCLLYNPDIEYRVLYRLVSILRPKAKSPSQKFLGKLRNVRRFNGASMSSRPRLRSIKRWSRPNAPNSETSDRSCKLRKCLCSL